MQSPNFLQICLVTGNTVYSPRQTTSELVFQFMDASSTLHTSIAPMKKYHDIFSTVCYCPSIQISNFLALLSYACQFSAVWYFSAVCYLPAREGLPWSTFSNFSKCFLAFFMLMRVAADAVKDAGKFRKLWLPAMTTNWPKVNDVYYCSTTIMDSLSKFFAAFCVGRRK